MSGTPFALFDKDVLLSFGVEIDFAVYCCLPSYGQFKAASSTAVLSSVIVDG